MLIYTLIYGPLCSYILSFMGWYELQQLVSRLSHACKEFGLKISLKKTNVMAQDAGHPPTIAIDGYNLEVVENFTYLGSTISNSLSIDVEVNSRIAKATAVMAKLNQ